MILPVSTWSCIPSANYITVHLDSAIEFMSGFPFYIPKGKDVRSDVFPLEDVRPDMMKVRLDIYQGADAKITNNDISITNRT